MSYSFYHFCMSPSPHSIWRWFPLNKQKKIITPSPVATAQISNMLDVYEGHWASGPLLEHGRLITAGIWSLHLGDCGHVHYLVVLQVSCTISCTILWWGECQGVRRGRLMSVWRAGSGQRWDDLGRGHWTWLELRWRMRWMSAHVGLNLHPKSHHDGVCSDSLSVLPLS